MGNHSSNGGDRTVSGHESRHWHLDGDAEPVTCEGVVVDTESILRQFEHPTTFPEAAVRAAIADKAHSISDLLRVLSQVVSEPTQATQDQRYVAHFFAILLLAQFREPQACPLLVRFGRLPSDTLAYPESGQLLLFCQARPFHKAHLTDPCSGQPPIVQPRPSCS